MGAGKSTVGPRLAMALGMPFQDSDTLVSAREASPITEIFIRHGERYFRELEEGVILEILHGPSTILATGGGAVLSERVRHALQQLSCCVYLQVDIQEQLRRLASGADRPLAGEKEHLQGLQHIREPFYHAVAHAVVPTSGRPIQEVTAEVLARYQAHGLRCPGQ